ncbi:hypothetical protein M8C21_024840 [Ambrosia artemisiifolia]|uniref:TF-B3 domain-containing protein n=1 Tax=Ambrosia artemisiifolia TaxID=4212 RepID=A0AAD5CFY6_AMBAR|nr:hypothetical protein M8C21_024840 [Ambrosia artemisiifolia]
MTTCKFPKSVSWIPSLVHSELEPVSLKIPNQMDPSPNTSSHQKQKPADQDGGERDPDFWPLSSKKPYFNVVIKNTHLGKTFRMSIPRGLYEKLPAAKIPAKIVYKGKVWDLFYIGNQGAINCRFENQTWERFATENKLEVGDVCVFELMQGCSNSTSIKFRLQILKDEFPTELVEKAEGFRSDNPICID